MRLLSWLIFAAGLACLALGIWGCFSARGQDYFDQRRFALPATALCAAPVFLFMAWLISLVRRGRMRRSK
ncbi:MAG TPA: hypothetical protein VFC78_18015 [Tepidisphaeraceae bacterium]|nr:hypothetical protein [Tepidisphaeraceae bacterium]